MARPDLSGKRHRRLSGDPGTVALVAALLLTPSAAWAACAAPAPVRVPGAARIGLGPGADPRVALDVTQPPWSALGRVQNATLGGRCTGALIGPRTVLTAAHCVVSVRTGRFLQPDSLHFVLGYDHGHLSGHARVSALAVAPGYVASPPVPSGADWAVLTLTEAPAPAALVLRLAGPADLPAPPPEGIPVALAGYQQDRPEVLLGDLGCRVTAVVRDGAGRPMLLHSCSGTRGISGAPLLARTAAGEWVVAGVASGGTVGCEAAGRGAAYAGVGGGAAVPAGSIDVAAALPPGGARDGRAGSGLPPR